MAENKDAKPDAAKKDGAGAETADAPKSKKPMMIGLGAVVVVVLGGIMSMMAMPKKKVTHHLLEGPFISKLCKNEIQVNLAGEGSKRYLAMELNVEYFAYEDSYVTARLGTGSAGGGEHADKGAGSGDPLYLAMLQDSLLQITSRKTRDQVTDPVQIEAFLEEVRVAVDPLLFPVCIGDAHGQTQADSKSGLRAGESIDESSFRGYLYEHSIALDATKHTVKLDDGPTVTYQGTERDLTLDNGKKQVVKIDVSTVDPEFVGTVPVGIAGKVRRIYRDKFLVQ
jgi:flagellar basal body-associated protein FliL